MQASAQVGSMDVTRWLIWFLNRLAAAMNQANKTVGTARNSTRLQPYTPAGRPDLVVLDDRAATIMDVKTCQQRPWHRIQVMIYHYAPPLALPQYRNVRIGGEVI